MRTRTPSLALGAATLALLLGACTSGEADPVSPTTPADAPLGPDEAVPDDSVGATAGPDANGYLCRYVAQSAQTAMAGAELGDPFEIITQDSDDSWACEVRDGDQPLVRVSILRGEGVWEEQRELAGDDASTTAPPYLGDGLVSGDRITGLTYCVDPTAPGTYEPYAMVVESLVERDEDLSVHLLNASSALARSLDQSVGCSPRMARGEVPAATGAP